MGPDCYTLHADTVRQHALGVGDWAFLVQDQLQGADRHGLLDSAEGDHEARARRDGCDDELE